MRENLDPFAKLSDAEILEALAEVKLKEYVDSLSEGLNTDVTERSLFSTGQK